jgi:DNA-binding NarL/FixJ family response regulator
LFRGASVSARNEARLHLTTMSEPATCARVMIVEDDRDTLERIADAIATDPRTSVAEKARTGREAIAGLTRASPDVLLVDLGLPDMHGTEVIRYCARNLPECDVMVITMFGDEGNVLASVEAGATGYVLKDANAADLVANILELRAGGAPMSPGIARMVLARMRGDLETPNAAPPVRVVLTAREIEVLSALSRGYTYAEIGDRLGISLGTVTSHIKNSYRKLTVHSGAAAVTRAAELGLLRPATRKEPPR